MKVGSLQIRLFSPSGRLLDQKNKGKRNGFDELLVLFVTRNLCHIGYP